MTCSTCSACNKDKKIEHFSYEVPKNMCHYGCSNMNTTNIILFVLILVLIYLLSKEKISFNFGKK
jgi:hypothetical protein